MGKRSSNITTLLLDADGVVQLSGSGLLSDIAALCPDPDKRRAFTQAVFLAERPCLTGEMDFPTALEEVLAAWETDVPIASALALWNQIDPVPDILDAVAKLRARGIRVCLATNQQAHRADIMANRLGYAQRFDHLFFSHELGVAKPAPEFFSRILTYLSTDAERTLFIDDHTQNVAAAARVGCSAAVFHIDQGLTEFAAVLERHGLSTE